MKKLVSPVLIGTAALTGAAAAWIAFPRPESAAVAQPPAAATSSDGGRPVSLASSSAAVGSVKTSPVRRVRLAADIQVVGTVSHDQNQFALVGPLVAGRISRLFVGVGDKVRRGQVLADLESSEVGQARAGLISHRARLVAAEANLNRERDLAEKRVSSARDAEQARAQHATEKAGVNASIEKLRTMGLTDADIHVIEQRDAGGRLPVRAPIDGVVLERLVTLGQAVERATDAFKIANLRRLWVQLELYEKDLDRVRIGQEAEVRAEAFPGEVFRARVTYISPVINPETRTARVRVEISNPDGKLRIGQLITARLLGNAAQGPEALAVPSGALARVDGKSVVFVRHGDGFRPRPIDIGASTGELVEVRRGLEEAEAVAIDGAFLLKSELLR